MTWEGIITIFYIIFNVQDVSLESFPLFFRSLCRGGVQEMCVAYDLDGKHG